MNKPIYKTVKDLGKRPPKSKEQIQYEKEFPFRLAGKKSLEML